MQVAQIDFQAKTASKDFTNSLKSTGFAVIKNHPIDYKLVEEVFKEWADFFNSPYKQKYLYHNDTQDGLFPMWVSETAVGYKVKDIKEFYHYYPWGQYPAELSEKTKQLYTQMTEVATQLLQWVEAHLSAEIRAKLSQPLTQMIENSQQILMRILHYPPLTGKESEGAIRAGAHTDINLLTVLVAASQAGLQVQDAQGNWLEVPVDPGMLAINIGDMLQEATEGFYKSTAHQVINPADETRFKSRYSIPLFLHPRPEVVLSQRYTAGSFLNERLAALGIKKK
ncbi:MAG: isopenicillin N synthase family dioxygenase [Burkholderiales bacterium]